MIELDQQPSLYFSIIGICVYIFQSILYPQVAFTFLMKIRPLIMWNPRLVSGDVGVGFNVRNLRRNFLR